MKPSTFISNKNYHASLKGALFYIINVFREKRGRLSLQIVTARVYKHSPLNITRAVAVDSYGSEYDTVVFELYYDALTRAADIRGSIRPLNPPLT